MVELLIPTLKSVFPMVPPSRRNLLSRAAAATQMPGRASAIVLVPSPLQATAFLQALFGLLFLILSPGSARANWIAQGTCAYEARTLDPAGLSPVTGRRPISGAVVQIQDANSGELLAVGATDS